MKPTCQYSDMQCPFQGLLNLLSGSWTSYILWLLHEHGDLRFGELRKHMPGLSAKVLTERLRRLEGAELISRHAEATIPPKVTYKLTRRGHELQGPLDRLNELATAWAMVPA